MSKKDKKKSRRARSRAAAPARRAAAPMRARKAAPAGTVAAGDRVRLIFPRSFQEEGFTSADISQFNNKDIPSAVRELLQNSLDAAMEIRRPAVARFAVARQPLAVVPGLAEYEAAFKSARARRPDDGQAADIIADIDQALRADTVPFLFVEDNGVGLNPRRMDALNGDGVNVKGGEQAIGSYGNGHLTVFCLSRLRYILYGGVTEEGMTASGHAILASHTGEGGYRASRHGFYAAKLSDKEGQTNTYPQDGKVPAVIKGRLENIRREFNSGTVVAIPGFNHFGADEEGPIAEDVMRVAAMNFFPAIHEGHLEVRVLENGEETVIAKNNLASHVERMRNDRKVNRAGFPTGAKAYASYQSMLNGGEHLVDIKSGSIRLRLRQGAEQGVETTRVTFCRNGMWVTDQVGMLAKTHFADKVPFDALFLASVGECGKFHDLMAKAEGRLHIDLDAHRLGKVADRTALRAAFEAARDFLNQTVASSETEEFQPSNFYQIETGQAVGGGKVPSIMQGRAQPVPGTFAHAVSVKKQSGKKRAERQKRRGGNTMIVRTMSKPVGADAIEIGVAFQEDCDNCELQMSLDNGTDPSCTAPLPKRPLYIRAATVGGGRLDLIGEEGKRVGAMLGGAKSGERRIVRVEFEAGQLRESVPHAVACEFYRRAAESANKGGAQ